MLIRPLIVFGLVMGVYFAFPGLRRYDVEIRLKARRPACVESLRVVLLDEEGVFVRRYRGLLNPQGEVRYPAVLSAGTYEAVLSVECADGEVHKARRPLEVDEAFGVTWTLRGGCRCVDET